LLRHIASRFLEIEEGPPPFGPQASVYKVGGKMFALADAGRAAALREPEVRSGSRPGIA